jgi:hypothetical protein
LKPLSFLYVCFTENPGSRSHRAFASDDGGRPGCDPTERRKVGAFGDAKGNVFHNSRKADRDC